MSARKAIWRLGEALRKELWALTTYRVNEAQLPIHLDEHRVKLISGGERAGKSMFSASEMLTWVAVSEPGALYWIVAPDYDQAHPEMDYLIEAMRRTGIIDPASVSTPKQGAWRAATAHGVVIETKTSSDPRTLAGKAPDGLLMVEAAQQDYSAYLRCRGRVAEKRGPLLLSGTFESSMGWYAETWQRWQADNVEDARSFSLPTWSNVAIYPGGRDDPEIKSLEATYPPDRFQERFGAVPCPPATLVLKAFSFAEHVTEDAEYVKGKPVQLWIDPGYRHAYAVAVVQIRGGNVYHFDELWKRGWIGERVVKEAMSRSWWGDVRGLVMDIAGRQHQAAESQLEVWERMTGYQVTSTKVPIAAGIDRHRTFLRDPGTGKPRLLHHPRCTGTLWEYGQYKYAEDSERRPISDIPIDRDNDAMKALAYGLVANFGFVEGSIRPPKRQIVFSVHRGDRQARSWPPESDRERQ